MVSLCSFSSLALPTEVAQSSFLSTNILSEFSKNAFHHANDALFSSLVMENLAFKDNWGKFRRFLSGKFSQPHLIDEGIVALKRYLILKAAVKDSNDTLVAPSPLVDELWSYFTQFTREYEILCKNLMQEETNKKIIHRSFNDNKKETNLYKNTLALYLHAFETTPSQDFWPRPPSSSSREKRGNAPSNSEAESTTHNNSKRVKEERNKKKENNSADNITVNFLDEEEKDKGKTEQKESSGSATDTADLNRASKYMSSGDELYNQGKYGEALDEYCRAIAIRESAKNHTRTAMTSGGGFKRQYSNTSVETQSTAQIKESAAHSSRRYNVDSDPRAKESHSPFFCKEVLQRLEAQSLCKPNTDGKVRRVQQVTNGVCHICHGRKPLTATFICGITSHSYCERHLSTRLGLCLKELIGNTSKNSKKYHEGYCPVCTLYCTCSKCQRRLDTIYDYVASLCWIEYGSNATISDITESEVEKIVTRVVASLDLLCFAEGKELIPMFNKTPAFTASSILASSKEQATNDTNIKAKSELMNCLKRRKKL